MIQVLGFIEVSIDSITQGVGKVNELAAILVSLDYCKDGAVLRPNTTPN